MSVCCTVSVLVLTSIRTWRTKVGSVPLIYFLFRVLLAYITAAADCHSVLFENISQTLTGRPSRKHQNIHPKALLHNTLVSTHFGSLLKPWDIILLQRTNTYGMPHSQRWSRIVPLGVQNSVTGTQAWTNTTRYHFLKVKLPSMLTNYRLKTTITVCTLGDNDLTLNNDTIIWE